VSCLGDRERSFKIRVLILSLIFLSGLISGFIYHRYHPEISLDNDLRNRNEFSYMGISLSKENYGTKLEDSRVSFFENGHLKTEVIAKEMVWNKDCPIVLKDVILYEYSTDGKNILAQMNGDHGEITVNKESGEIENLKVWGNTKIKKFVYKPEE
jgi:hypothetical protein